MRDENDDDGMVFQQISLLLAEKGLISDRWPKTIILKRGTTCKHTLSQIIMEVEHFCI